MNASIIKLDLAFNENVDGHIVALKANDANGNTYRSYPIYFEEFDLINKKATVVIKNEIKPNGMSNFIPDESPIIKIKLSSNTQRSIEEADFGSIYVAKQRKNEPLVEKQTMAEDDFFFNLFITNGFQKAIGMESFIVQEIAQKRVWTIV